MDHPVKGRARPRRKRPGQYHHGDLREALLQEAHARLLPRYDLRHERRFVLELLGHAAVADDAALAFLRELWGRPWKHDEVVALTIATVLLRRAERATSARRRLPDPVAREHLGPAERAAYEECLAWVARASASGPSGVFRKAAR